MSSYINKKESVKLPGGGLPDHYRPATRPDVPAGRACGTCFYFNEEDVAPDGRARCMQWGEYVEGGFVCNAWKNKGAMEEQYKNESPVPGKDKFTTKAGALAKAKQLGCEGTHSMDEDGQTIYMPCSTHAAYDKLSKSSKTSKPSKMSTPSYGEAAADALKVGDFVSWNSSGGRSQGQITRIQRNGGIKVPDSSFTIMGDAENPAALITVWRKTAEKWEATDRKVGHKFSTLSKIGSLRESKNLFESVGPYNPTQGVQSAAKRALKWIGEGKAGKGSTDVGRRRASQLAAGESVSRSVVGRMRSFFARHEVDRRAKGFFAGESGFPTPGRVAWDAWGGDAGRSWANGIDLEND